MMQPTVTPLPLLETPVQNSDIINTKSGGDGSPTEFGTTLAKAISEKNNPSDTQQESTSSNNLQNNVAGQGNLPVKNTQLPNEVDVLTDIREADVNTFFTEQTGQRELGSLIQQLQTQHLVQQQHPKDQVNENRANPNHPLIKDEQSSTLLQGKIDGQLLSLNLESNGAAKDNTTLQQGVLSNQQQTTTLNSTTLFKENIAAHLSENSNLKEGDLNKILNSVNSVKIEVGGKKQAQNNPLRPVTILESIAKPTFTPNDTEAVTTENVIAKLTVAPFETLTPTILRERTPTTLRQDIGDQYFNAKLKTSDVELQVKTESQQFEQTTDNNAQSKLTAATGQKISVLSDSSATTPFSAFLGESSTESVSGSSKIAEFMPNSPQVYEDDVIQQVVRKLQVSRQINDSKMVVKLHPAELGELKIDVQLKEGSINASIIAQNRQVQEILEKNLPKLRELMEQQGLKVNEIAIKFESDVMEDFKQFEEHLAGDSEFGSKSKQSASNAKFSLEIDEENSVENNANEGVNVKV